MNLGDDSWLEWVLMTCTDEDWEMNYNAYKDSLLNNTRRKGTPGIDYPNLTGDPFLDKLAWQTWLEDQEAQDDEASNGTGGESNPQG